VEKEHDSQLASLDDILAEGSFGNSAYITAQLHMCYMQRLESLSPQVPAAKSLLRTLETSEDHARYLVFGDMVFRCAVQHTMRHLWNESFKGLTLSTCASIFDEIDQRLRAKEPPSVRAALGDTIGPEAYHGAIWSEGLGGPMAAAFRDLVRAHYAQVPVSVTPSEIETLRAGVRLVERLLPRCSQSVFSHAHVIGVFSSEGPSSGLASSSEYWLSGTVFLGRRLLVNPWYAAEHVFHEALHQQLYDFRQRHSVLRWGFDRADAPLIESPWNLPDRNNNNQWDVHRSLAAFHVYVHLAVFACLAVAADDELRRVYGKRVMTSKATSIARARYLQEQLRGALWEELGAAGQRLVDWFGMVLDAVDQSPPPPGARVHLLLDRYRKEAREIEQFTHDGGPPSQFVTRLEDLLNLEIRSVRSVFLAANRLDVLSSFEQSVKEAQGARSDNEPVTDNVGARFARVRMAISRSIRSLASGRFELPGPPECTALVEDMVRANSDTVRELVGR